jgi:hypothetical protein
LLPVTLSVTLLPLLASVTRFIICCATPWNNYNLSITFNYSSEVSFAHNIPGIIINAVDNFVDNSKYMPFNAHLSTYSPERSFATKKAEFLRINAMYKKNWLPLKPRNLQIRI